jgi:hypothetical protein
LVKVTFTSKSFWNQDVKKKQETGSSNIDLAASLKKRGAMDMDHPPPQHDVQWQNPSALTIFWSSQRF